MIFFEHLFVIIARFYIKVWKKYKDWSSKVRYAIGILTLFNYTTILILTDKKMNKVIFLSLSFFTYILISFIKPHLNNKDFVENYTLNKFWEKFSLIYIFGSISLFILTFWLMVVKT